MRKIKLNYDKANIYTLVDNENYHYLMQWDWRLDSKGYVCRTYKHRNLYMHRLIMFGNDDTKEYQVDHINHDVLDNRKCNLRKCTQTQNLMNRGAFKNNKSGHKGIYWNNIRKRWIPQIRVNGKKIYLGMFVNINDAIKARKDAEVLYQGEFAKS